MIHFHDLRHTGNQFAADAGATLRELMDRMGHSTARAAVVYLHRSDERQRAIADALSQLAEGSQKRPSARRSGTQRARKRRNASRRSTTDYQTCCLAWGFGLVRLAGFEPATRCLEDAAQVHKGVS